jgi:acetate kinase
VQEAARNSEERAKLALQMYAERVRAAVGALTVTMGGIEALIFTAGVGEHASDLRAAVCQGLEILGLRLDASCNSTCKPDADIAQTNSPARILVLQTREELMIAREARRLLSSSSPQAKSTPDKRL